MEIVVGILVGILGIAITIWVAVDLEGFKRLWGRLLFWRKKKSSFYVVSGDDDDDLGWDNVEIDRQAKDVVVEDSWPPAPYREQPRERRTKPIDGSKLHKKDGQ